ncbi:hypothetical protein BJ875DRAFT_437782 [Amylocarpus encephaloides]|uniref:Uncharacterized protein n=1 Tax=Amylocarpus encephaloides TaxID=45428 RepID=A0A9P7YRJ8_9HELO|nr:hypothetical protein BJ875DRAFT_437782 [Amylocarpus encephaloides]
MDSMRSLNTSLPGTSPPKQQVGEPPEQLLQAFKSAALSVTTLYKTAATNQAKARCEGYQDSLDELLAFLDKEDIGLSDGEGWRIRRWATERLDGRDSTNQHPESEDEAADKNDGCSSPILPRSHSATRLSPNPSNDRSGSPSRSEPAAPSSIVPPPVAIVPTPTAIPSPISIPQESTFSFRSAHPYPQESELTNSDFEMQDRSQSHDSHGFNPPGITFTRPPRTTPRQNNHPGRLGTRSSSTIGRGAGQKRKINIGDFFDIGNLGKDGFGGGGKRGRFT